MADVGSLDIFGLDICTLLDMKISHEDPTISNDP